MTYQQPQAAYTDHDAVRAYMGIIDDADDDLLDVIIAQTQAYIDRYTLRTFSALAGVYTFNVPNPASRVLMLGRDLLTISTLLNGDGSIITSADYVLRPNNDLPKYAIALKEASAVSWRADAAGNTEGVISVNGDWGYSETPPTDIVLACVRLVGYFYKLKDSQVFDVTAMPDMGQIIIPKGIPAEVKLILERYRRPAL